MKLFGGKITKKAVRGDKASVMEGTRILRVDENKKRAASLSWAGEKKRAMIIVLWSAAAVLVLALLLSLYIGLTKNAPEAEHDASVSTENMETNDVTSAETENPVIILPLSPVLPAETAEPGMAEESAELIYGETDENLRNNNCYTFLLAGYDYKGINVDTIMVSKLDVAEGTLNVVSIPRDTLVNVSWDLKKINTVMAYEEGDPRRFINEISGIVGFPIDYYSFIDGYTVEKMIDAIGGVYYTVPRNMYYDDASLDLHIRVSAGHQWLSGNKVVQVLRFRGGNDGSGYANGELGRIETQQDFLRSLLCQFMDMGEIPNFEDFAEIFIENSTGNLDLDKLKLFVEELMKLDEQNIQFATLPGKNVGIRNTYYYEIDPLAWTELINKSLNPYSQEMALHNLDILMYDSAAGTVMSTSGEKIDLDSFY